MCINDNCVLVTGIVKRHSHLLKIFYLILWRENAGVKLPVVSHTHLCPLYAISYYGKAGNMFF